MLFSAPFVKAVAMKERDVVFVMVQVLFLGQRKFVVMLVKAVEVLGKTSPNHVLAGEGKGL